MNLSQVPILVPLVVAGAFLGSVWSVKSPGAVWKKAVLAATVSGLLNVGYVFVLGLIMPGNNLPSGLTQSRIPSVNLPTDSAFGGLAFMAVSGLTGFLVVVTIYLSVIGILRYRRGKTLEPEE